MKGIEYNYPEEQYHSDPCSVPSLSASIAKTLVLQSELHAYREHPRLGGKPRVATHSMDVGTICHAMMLGKPLPEIEHVPFDDYRTNDAKALRNLARECGKIPLNNKEWGEHGSLIRAAEALRNKLHDMGVVFDPRHCEVALFWQRNGVQCRSKLDNLEGYCSYDLKFTECAHPDFIDRQVKTMGYQIQEAAYNEAVNECVPEAEGRASFTLLFCETHEPYCITPARMSAEQSMIGQLQWSYAQRRWADLLTGGAWHEYIAPGTCHTIQAKPWELTQALERYGQGDSPLLSDGGFNG